MGRFSRSKRPNRLGQGSSRMTERELWEKVVTLFYTKVEYGCTTDNGNPLIHYYYVTTQGGCNKTVGTEDVDWLKLYEAIQSDTNLQDVQEDVWKRYPAAKELISVYHVVFL